jgi:hypothetical protein
VSAARKLWEAGGDVGKLKKAELFALLIGVRESGINAQSALTTVLLPRFRECCARAEQTVPGVPGWQTIVHVLYQPPPTAVAVPIATEGPALLPGPAGNE